MPHRSYPLKNLKNFLEIPLLKRSDIAEHGDEIVNLRKTPDYLRNTSGTTFGTMNRNPLVSFHNASEIMLWQKLHLDFYAINTKSAPLMLRFLSIDHGVDLTFSPGIFQVPLEKMAHFRHVVNLLEKKFNFIGFSDRVQGIVGTLSRIKLLTCLCIENAIDSKSFSISFLGCHSQLLTDRWRDLLTEYWGVVPTEFYGISEIPGVIGERCEECKGYHLSPLAYIETLDPLNFEPVTFGPARLVATGLYPLVKIQPMIRYDTEDIIYVNERKCAKTFMPSIEYIGRAHETFLLNILGKTQLIVNPMKIHNIIDSEPSINIRQNDRSFCFGIQYLGFPKYKLSIKQLDRKWVIQLDIELIWYPKYFKKKTKELYNRLFEKLILHTPELLPSVQMGITEVELNLLPPNTLDSLTEA